MATPYVRVCARARARSGNTDECEWFCGWKRQGLDTSISREQLQMKIFITCCVFRPTRDLRHFVCLRVGTNKIE